MRSGVSLHGDCEDDMDGSLRQPVQGIMFTDAVDVVEEVFVQGEEVLRVVVEYFPTVSPSTIVRICRCLACFAGRCPYGACGKCVNAKNGPL